LSVDSLHKLGDLLCEAYAKAPIGSDVTALNRALQLMADAGHAGCVLRLDKPLEGPSDSSAGRAGPRRQNNVLQKAPRADR
jgi:hypothetical protein